ncbi:MAG: LamG-like jellyroll fold domain-containing protein [Cyanobium sp.]|nr:LamG-like jellyroll fold domain-containing protein [Cyanobium sp.]
MSEQSEEERLQRVHQGGSDDTSPSFNNPEYVRYDSLGDSKDLGSWANLRADLSGEIGAEVGTQSLFFKFQVTEPGPIRLRLTPVNPWTDRFLQLALLDSDQRRLALDEKGFARENDVVNTPADEASVIRPVGEYTIVLSCSQWQRTPFGISLGISPTAALYATLTGTGRLGGPGGGPLLEASVARLDGALQGRGSIGGGGSLISSGRVIKLLGSGPLTGRGRLTGTLDVRDGLSVLGAAPLTGRGSLGGSRVTTSSGGSRFWVSRLTTQTELAANTEQTITLMEDGDSLHTFLFQAAGQSNRFHAFVRRNIKGEVLWTRISNQEGGDDFSDRSNFPPRYAHFSLPGGDSLLVGAQTVPNGIGARSDTMYHLARLSRGGTLLWHRRSRFSLTADGRTWFCNYIHKLEYNPVTGLLNFAASSFRMTSLYDTQLGPIFVGTLDPANGDVTFTSVQSLPGGYLTHYPCGFCIQPNGRPVLFGQVTGTLNYSFCVELNESCTSIIQAHQYTNGGSFVLGIGQAVVDYRGWFLLQTFSNNSGITEFDSTASGCQIQNHAPFKSGIDTSTSELIYDPQYRAIHQTGTSNLHTFGLDGEIAYRRTILSTTHPAVNGFASFQLVGSGANTGVRAGGLGSRMYPAEKWMVRAAGKSIAAIEGHAVVAMGHEVEIPVSTVTTGGQTYTVQTDTAVPGQNRDNTQIASLVRNPITPSLLGTGVTTTPAGLPALTLSSGGSTLTFQLAGSSSQRGNIAIYPAPQEDLPLIEEPDSYMGLVALHLPMSGMRTTNLFTDYSYYAHSMISAGSAVLTPEQALYPDLGARYETVSAKLNGTTDWITGPTHPAFQFRRADLTVETRIFISTAAVGAIFENSPVGSPTARTNSFVWYFSDTSRRLSLYLDGALRLTTTLTVPLNSWAHIMLVRSQGIWRIFINGAPDHNALRYDTDLSAGGCLIGRFCDTTSSTLNAFIQDFRITNGVARCTRRFTPRSTPIQYTPLVPPTPPIVPAEPTEIAGTLPDLDFNNLVFFLRGNGSGSTFADSSPFAHTVVAWGNTTQTAGIGKWSGPGIAYDGDNDYLTVPSNPVLALGNGDYTVSLWATRTGNATGADEPQVLLDSRTAEPSSQFCLLIARTSTGRQLMLYVNGVARIVGNMVEALTRYHLEVARVGGVTRMFMNGMQVGQPWVDSTNFTSTAWTIGRGSLQVNGSWWHFLGIQNDIRILVGKGLHASSFTPPNQAYGGPPSVTAQYWRFRDPIYSDATWLQWTEIGLYQGATRHIPTAVTSSPAVGNGALANLYNEVLTDSSLAGFTPKATVQTADFFLRFDLGSPKAVDRFRFGSTSSVPQFTTGLRVEYSTDDVTWTTFGWNGSIPLPAANSWSRYVAFPAIPAVGGDSNFERVSLLLDGEGNGATFADRSAYQIPVSAVGGATQSDVRSRYGTKSIWLPSASQSYLSAAQTPFLSFGTGDFTVEMDVYITAAPSTDYLLYDAMAVGGASSRANAFAWLIDSSLRLDVFSNSARRGASVGTVPLNQWVHLRLTRASGVWRYFIEGTVDATTFTLTTALRGGGFTIGRNADGDFNRFDGWIDNIRVCRVARSTDSFALPGGPWPSL